MSEKAIGKGTQLAPTGSVLMVVRGMILAHTFPVAVTTGDVAFNQDIKALVPSNGFEPEFILYWLQHRADDVLQLCDVSNHGTKRLPSTRLFGMGVPKPSTLEQRELGMRVHAVELRQDAERAFLQQLQATKSALMSVLLTGELRVTPGEAIE